MAKSTSIKKGMATSNKCSGTVSGKVYKSVTGSKIYEGSTKHIAKNIINKYSKAFEQLSKK